MRRIFISLIIAVLSLTVVLPAESASRENPYGTATIDPAAPNEVILTLAKGRNRAEFAYPRLLKMKQTTISIYEPFLKKRQRFTVIPLKSLFNFVGISGKDKVVTKALNDYVFKSTASQLISARGYLAIKRDGLPISYDQGGPIRIIFPDDSKWSKNLEAWNWSLISISVE